MPIFAALFGPEGEGLVLPLTRLKEVGYFSSLLGYAPVKALLPLPILAAIAPLVWWFFRDTWRELDAEAAAYRQETAGTVDYRPAACLLITAIVLTMQEYYGGRQFYDELFRPILAGLEQRGHSWIKLGKYDEYYGYVWWVATRVIGYVLVPLPLWKLLFPKDSLLDMGFRLRGFFQHLWIYGLCLGVVLPTMLIVASQPDFGTYYPFYKNSERSWFDFLAWEVIYFIQFLALETFFRGWMVGALRKSLGSAAIFAMAVPYCMIHYGKPYLEAHGAIVAGVVLGSLAMRTRSIYSGFLVHITVAFLMDILALWRRDALPSSFWAGG
jgi:membrane protease YdiL (CAAX protease family)